MVTEVDEADWAMPHVGRGVCRERGLVRRRATVQPSAGRTPRRSRRSLGVSELLREVNRGRRYNGAVISSRGLFIGMLGRYRSDWRGAPHWGVGAWVAERFARRS